MKSGISHDAEQRFARQAMAGFAIPGVELRVVGPNGKDVPQDGTVMGEIVARGDAVMEGYWRQPEAMAAVMKEGWFHTGDIATVDAYNYIQIVDRKKEIIVSGGENISSLEVEKVLLAHPGVYEVAVIPLPDEKWGEVPMAVVVLKPGSEVAASELIQFCRSRLSRYKCPRAIEFVASLPKTGSGKLLKRDLRNAVLHDGRLALRIDQRIETDQDSQ
jgi:fatty-acyl-CoA synthase